MKRLSVLRGPVCPALFVLRWLSIASALAASIATVGGSAAKADVLSPPTFLETADVLNVMTYDDNFMCFGAAMGLTCPGSGLGAIATGAGFANATTTVLNPADGPLTSSSSAHGGQFLNASASSYAEYDLELVGPPPVFPNQTVPVRVDLSAHADVSLSDTSDILAGAEAGAGIYIQNPNSQTVQPVFSVFAPLSYVPSDFVASDGSLCSGECTSSADFSDSLLYLLQPNVQYTVDVGTVVETVDNRLNGVSVNRFGSSFQTANADVDPHFYQDPLYGNPAYTLELSPGISNESAASAPEPSSWELFGIGIGLMGLSKRRRANSAGSLGRA